jgi:uncharacterized protein (TIGR03083 family)
VPDLRPPAIVDVRGLFGPDREALLELLDDLGPADWESPTVCRGWDVRDVALHLLGGDLGNIAIRRDGVRGVQMKAGESLAAFVNRINDEWITAARRLSPRLIREHLAFTGPLLFEHLESLDPLQSGGVVSWASARPAPNWLDVAREYMERWVHQQHIRDAVGRPGQEEARYAGPVVAASVFALPPALRDRRAGTVTLSVQGPAGGTWTTVSGDGEWTLWQGRAAVADCAIAIDARDWWRLVTLGVTPDEAAHRASVSGDAGLARAVLGAVAIIA